jgi:hypothetical protein
VDPRVEGGPNLRQPYTYIVLRYRHDPLAGELLNVGVLLHAPRARFLGSAMRSTYGRLSRLYPDFDGVALTADLKRAETALNRLAGSEGTGLFAGDASVRDFARRVLDDPAGAYVWSEVGSGLTRDPDEELARLYDRFVGRFDEREAPRRSDSDVWRPARDRLAERHLERLFEPKTIATARDEVAFPHAWKNGVWHCVQPLSFDLATAADIQEKAARWVGHMVGLQKAEDDFRPYFLVGAPADAALDHAFERAVTFLAEAPGKAPPRIVREDEVGAFVDEFEQAARAHAGEYDTSKPRDSRTVSTADMTDEELDLIAKAEIPAECLEFDAEVADWKP